MMVRVPLLQVWARKKVENRVVVAFEARYPEQRMEYFIESIFMHAIIVVQQIPSLVLRSAGNRASYR